MSVSIPSRTDIPVVSPLAAELMAVCTAAEAQLAAVIVAASDVPALTIQMTKAIRSRRIYPYAPTIRKGSAVPDKGDKD